jgi:formylglycine-generating enzyme required for sulfatase activity
VLEWVADWFGKDYYSHSEANNPRGPVSGETRVLRGGEFLSPVSSLRCASRGWGHPNNRSYFIGFRVCVAARQE